MLRTVGLLAVALASGSAQALGLGQIQVKSGLGQPLLAEIPVISSDPSELVNLDAGLASPETFTRIGLEPPIGIVADLRFTVGSDARGRPLIRITTVQPVTQPLLNFLVQVEWGQGRLVREYTAAMDSPGSIEAVADAPVEAPVVEAPARIERPVVTTPMPEAAVPAAGPQRPAPVAVQRPAASRPTPPRQPPAQADDGGVLVRAGDTASSIAARVAPEGVSSAQVLVGLYRTNPDAFIHGDVNRIRQGSVLRVPTTPELQAIEAREAVDLVRGAMRQRRQARTQPEATVAAPRPPATAPTATSAPAPAGRLEIVPPGAGRSARGAAQSGIASGGEGDMLRQELQQTKESLAARDAEVQELKSRLADLEKLQTDQQKLIALQNSQLHAAQQRPPATASQPPAATAPHASALPWIAGSVLVLLGLWAAAWNRRRSQREPVFRAPVDGARPSIADAFASAPAADEVVEPADVGEPVAPAPVVPSWEVRGPRASAATAGPVAVEPAPLPSDATAAGDADPTNVERLELAQAYLDLGDTDSARRLLGEVVDTGDATTRGVASQMLRTIG